MKLLTILICIFVIALSTLAQDWQTFYEKSGFKQTPRYAETIEFCKKLSEASPWVFYTDFGISPQGRELPLVIVDKDGNFSIEKVKKSGKAIMLIEAGIHAGEIDGKDAGLMLIRDIVIHKKYIELLNNVTLLFIPIFNVDGHERFGPYNRINQNGPEEMGWRVTAQNLNLNRDFVKAGTPEMKAWLKLFNQWLPDFFIDCHVTDGADYQYVVTYSLEIFGNMAPSITHWTNNRYLPDIKTMMENNRFPISPYVFFKEKHNPFSGLESWVSKPRFAHGYAAIQNRPGLLIETHMLKNYKQRVTGTYFMLLNSLKIINREYKVLKEAVKKADEFTASKEFRKQPFGLDFKMTGDSVMIEFSGIKKHNEKSNVSRADRVIYDSEPETYSIPYFNKQKPVKTAQLPGAYIFPPEWNVVTERLKLHGVEYKILSQTKSFYVMSYKFKNVKWRNQPYEGRHPLTYEIEEIEEQREYPKGSVIVPVNQRTARVIAHLLEPDAPDALVHWGFFDAIFEQKEYAEPYLLEKIAREMLAENPQLKKDFENKLATDSIFAASAKERLNYFYKLSPYWDQNINKYPVGKLYALPDSMLYIEN